MVISALVVTVDPRRLNETVAALERAGCECGERAGNRVPVVIESKTAREGRTIHDEIAMLDGVWSVDVVMVDFSGEAEEAEHAA